MLLFLNRLISYMIKNLPTVIIKSSLQIYLSKNTIFIVTLLNREVFFMRIWLQFLAHWVITNRYPPRLTFCFDPFITFVTFASSENTLLLDFVSYFLTILYIYTSRMHFFSLLFALISVFLQLPASISVDCWIKDCVSGRYENTAFGSGDSTFL